MFNQYRLKEVLAEYKQNFVSKQWGEEKYKSAICLFTVWLYMLSLLVEIVLAD